jgi:hypothetical protein
MSTLDSRTVKLSQAKRYIKHAAVNRGRSVFIWGPPGIGKSDIVKSVVEDTQAAGKKAKLFDLRLSMCEPTDIMGIPFFNSNTGQMNWAPPVLLPTQADGEENDLIVLFLDELNGAPPAVQSAAYQLILDRKVGAYTLPDNVAVVAAGNRETDKGVTFRMPKPLSNRFVHFEVRPDFNDWVEWATNKNISPSVVGYLTYRKEDLFKFDAKSSDRSFPTPRSWSFVSELLEDTSMLDEQDITDMIAGTVGEGTALQFAAHRKTAALLPNPTQILKGEIKDLQTKEISAMYSLATSLAYELKSCNQVLGREIKQDEFDTMLDNVLGFWLDHFEPEMVIMSVRLVLKYGITIGMHLANWKAFYERYGDLIRSA